MLTGAMAAGAYTLFFQPNNYAGSQTGAARGAGSVPPVEGSGPVGPGGDPAGTQAQEKGQGVSRKGRFDKNECQTCKNRKYQDGSDDPGVSFKTPTKIDPKAVAGAVRGHEMEHVFREQNKARQEGRQVLYQNVAIHTGICPECGRVYVSGGTTRTVTRGKQEAERFSVGLEEEENGDGKKLDAVA